MRRSTEHTRAEYAAPAPRFYKVELAGKSDVLRHSQPPVEIQQVDAAAQQNMLAVVDEFGFLAVPDFVGSRPAAQKRTRLKHLHRVPRPAQCCRCCESGQTSADDDDLSHRNAWAYKGPD